MTPKAWGGLALAVAAVTLVVLKLLWSVPALLGWVAFIVVAAAAWVVRAVLPKKVGETGWLAWATLALALVTLALVTVTQYGIDDSRENFTALLNKLDSLVTTLAKQTELSVAGVPELEFSDRVLSVLPAASIPANIQNMRDAVHMDIPSKDSMAVEALGNCGFKISRRVRMQNTGPSPLHISILACRTYTQQDWKEISGRSSKEVAEWVLAKLGSPDSVNFSIGGRGVQLIGPRYGPECTISPGQLEDHAAAGESFILYPLTCVEYEKPTGERRKAILVEEVRFRVTSNGGRIWLCGDVTVSIERLDYDR